MLKNKQFFKSIKAHKWRITLFILLFFLLFLFPSPNIYFDKIENTGGLSIAKEITIPSPPPVPIKTGSLDFPDFSAEAILVKDIPSGMVLYAKNELKRFPSASTTKIMTSLVALDHYKMDDVLMVKKALNDGRIMGLVPQERITFESLLYGTLIHSANDAAYTIADNYPQGLDKFVLEMNRKAGELNLSDTHFTNPAGFDDDNHFTTATDLARLSLYALNNKIFAKIVSTKKITVSDTSYTYFHDLVNVNELLGKVAGVAGVKTGYTQNSGEILVSEVKRNDRSILIVVLKSKDRFGESEKLIDYIFANFKWIPFSEIIPTIEMK